MNIPSYWMGDVASLWQLIDANLRFIENPTNYPKLYSGDDEEDPDLEEYDPVSEHMQVENGVGILTIEGSISATESYYDRYFGIVSYPMLSRGVLKLAQMYQAGEIHDIVLAFNTSGGDATGISGFADSIKLARKMAPRLWAWTGTKALSAGFWSAVSCAKLYMDEMAEVGSVGVVSVARTMKRYFEEMGVDHTVVRSGKYKALSTPFEELSEKALNEIEDKGNKLHGFFKSHVLASRPALVDVSTDVWGEGKTYFAKEAIEFGMADGPPISLSSLVSKLISAHNSQQVRMRTPSSNMSGGQFMATQVVFPDEETRAQASVGVPLDQLPHEVVDTPEPKGQEQKAEEIPTPPEPKAEAFAGLSGLSELVAQISTLSADRAKTAAELEAVRGQLSVFQASAEAATRCLVDAVGRLQVAAGFRPADLSGLPLSTLSDMYAKAKADFEVRMPAGRKSQAPIEDPIEDPAQQNADSDPRVARIRPISQAR